MKRDAARGLQNITASTIARSVFSDFARVPFRQFDESPTRMPRTLA
jgi:hypothetical protein